MNNLIIRKTVKSDYTDLFLIWKTTSLSIGLSDTQIEFNRMIKQNPDLCFTAVVDSAIIGGVLGGFDGRRAIVHHLAVGPVWQKQGIGAKLMQKLEAVFKELKFVKINFWVEANNRDVIEFYKNLGYVERDLITLSKTLR